MQPSAQARKYSDFINEESWPNPTDNLLLYFLLYFLAQMQYDQEATWSANIH